MIFPPHLFGPSREVACIQLFHLLLVVQVHIFCISPYRYCAALLTETDSLIINRIIMSQSCPRQVLDHTESFTRVLFKIIVIVIVILIVIVIVMISWSHLTLSPLPASK